MRQYILRRLLHSALTLFGVSLVVFGILRVLPGDPARMLLPDGAPESAVDELSRQLGLHEPLHVQYGIFLQSVVRGDFGQSFQFRTAATDVVAERIPATVHLTLVALALTVGLGFRSGSWRRHAIVRDSTTAGCSWRRSGSRCQTSGSGSC